MAVCYRKHPASLVHWLFWPLRGFTLIAKLFEGKLTCQKGHLEECIHCREPAGSSFAPGETDGVHELTKHARAGGGNLHSHQRKVCGNETIPESKNWQLGDTLSCMLICNQRRWLTCGCFGKVFMAHSSWVTVELSRPRGKASARSWVVRLNTHAVATKWTWGEAGWLCIALSTSWRTGQVSVINTWALGSETDYYGLLKLPRKGNTLCEQMGVM